MTTIVLWLTRNVAALGHSVILGVVAIIFSISEAYFSRLLTELNAVLRGTGYSVWQAERLRQIILPAKKRLWTLWWFSVALKVIAVACAGALFKIDSTSTGYDWVLRIGYGAVILTIPASVWAFRNFQRIEKKRDNLAFEEICLKEKKHLATELRSGDEHDFSKDDIAKAYNQPARPI